MATNRLHLQGIWLPLITPFRSGALDEASVRRLLHHYRQQPVDGFILAATTGEGLTLDDEETERLVQVAQDALAEAGCVLPVLLGLSGSDTRKLTKTLVRTAAWPIDGYLIACPYYTRPSQEGLVRHFTALADAAAQQVLIYNIPYRTGVNLRNEAMLQLAAHANITGVKDCCADVAQTSDLLARRPADFAVLTGEDALFHTALTSGADGGILASAHVCTPSFANVRNKLLAGDFNASLAEWRELTKVPRLLFAEPSPAPIKYWLWREGLIDSPEVRLPMVGVSEELAGRIDEMVG